MIIVYILQKYELIFKFLHLDYSYVKNKNKIEQNKNKIEQNGTK